MKHKTVYNGHLTIQANYGVKAGSDEHTAITYAHAPHNTAVFYTKTLDFRASYGEGTCAVSERFPDGSILMAAFVPHEYANTGLGGFTFVKFVDEFEGLDALTEWVNWGLEFIVPEMIAEHGSRITGEATDASVPPELLEDIPDAAIPAMGITIQLIKAHFGKGVAKGFLTVQEINRGSNEVVIDAPFFPHNFHPIFTERLWDGKTFVVAIVPKSVFGCSIVCKEVMPNQNISKVKDALVLRFHEEEEAEDWEELSA